ncbi:UNVERIFIED_CONTAM: Retrovirus-related Pol polyprotein from transposon RE1 [Sesamum radiatum]|uniref:Retrovirus-related Pol polyprotein from transposon RE1 n=1 Tax=Sesamum radiatum TaxID=300843 RepID=A0AAW2WJP4_SESRA
MVVLVYVDDLIIVGNDAEKCKRFKKYLQGCFQIKDLGPLSYFLRLEVKRTNSGIFLSQQKYAKDIIVEVGPEDTKHVESPIPQQHGYSVNIGEPIVNAWLYRRLIGRLLYLTLTRPDLSFGVQLLSQYLKNSRKPHIDMAKRLVRYIYKAPSPGIFFPTDNNLVLKAYCDADWASCPTTRKSVSGFVTFLGNALLTWRSKKQPTVALSSAEAEYRAMATTTKEIFWLVNLLKDMFVEVPKPIHLRCDNESAMHIASNPIFHERTKHIELNCHFIREKVQAKLLNFIFVPFHHLLADIFTKVLGHDQFRKILCQLRIEVQFINLERCILKYPILLASYNVFFAHISLRGIVKNWISYFDSKSRDFSNKLKGNTYSKIQVY